MSDWQALLTEPAGLEVTGGFEDWFTRIATRLLSGCRLLVGRDAHRFVEVEFYYHGPGHLDKFAHCDPVQRECGRWYFHKTRGTYRGGSFKGFDLTFGDERSYGGVLIRGLEAPDGTLIDGPSLCVDHLLDCTGAENVAALDKAIAARPAWDTASPLVLSWLPDEERSLLRCPRVGLSLKKAKAGSDMPRYIMRHYRFLSEPKRTSKGKVHLVLGLHAQGQGAESIREMTGCPPKTIQRYLADFEEGRQETDFTPYIGADLGPHELCKLAGACHANFGATAAT